MSNNIVTVNVSQTQAPIPSTLQKKGAMLSQGATNTTPGTLTLLTQESDLDAILTAALANTSLVYSAGTVTVTTTANHGIPNGDSVLVTIAGATPATFNGTWLATATGAATFTYLLPTAPSPTTASVPGTWAPENVAELNAMVTTFFGQGAAQSAYVLELGLAKVATGVSFLDSWIEQNPNTIYSYLVPRFWDNDSDFIAFLAQFQSNTAKTYFFVTTTLNTYSAYSALQKSVMRWIEAYQRSAYAANVLTGQTYSAHLLTFTTTSAHGVAVGDWFQVSGSTPAGYNGWHQALPGTTGSTIKAYAATDPGASTVLGTLVASYYADAAAPATEFSAAADFYVTLNYNPSNINKVTPNAFAFVFGVTPFPIQGNSSLLATLKAAYVNWIGTGAEGGISNAMVLWGTLADGRDFTYWYSVDWVQINMQLSLANEIINGSNNPINPLYYDQNGINRLQKRAQGVMDRGITYGLVLGPAPVDAVPFNTYVADNPSDFRIGKYAGLSVSYTPNRGFTEIIFNVNVTDFPAP